MRNDTNYPTSLADLFLTLTWLALQGFGGVLAVTIGDGPRLFKACELSRLAVGIFVFWCDGLRQQIQRFRLVVLSRAP